MKIIKNLLVLMLVLCMTVVCIPPVQAAAASDDDGLLLREYSDFAGTPGKARAVDITSDDLTHNKMFDGYIIENGVDVSHHNGKIDWKKVKESGVDFAIIRMAYRGYAPEGNILTDEKAILNLKGAKAAGLDVGVYFFSQAITTAEAKVEADYILDLIDGYELDLPVVMDFEYTAKAFPGRLWAANLTDRQRTDICLKFCETIEDAGYPAMVYANREMLESDLYADEIDSKYGIWLAEWSAKAVYKNDYTFWQFTSDGKVDGISSERVDLNVRYIDPKYRVKGIRTGNNADSGKPVLRWQWTDGAEKYKIYRAASLNGTYSHHDTTTSRIYTDTSAEAGKTYYYKIAAVTRGVEYVQSAAVERTCDLPRPTGVKSGNNASTGKITVSWNKVPGAAKYDIYRANYANGTYKYMYSTSGTSYTNTSADAGYTYYYKVVAVSNKTSYANSAMSSYVERTCDLPAPKIKGGNRASDGKPQITWDKVPGAAKYEVYRANYATGTYTKMYTTVYTTYTNTSANAGYTYFYKVIAVSDRTSYANSAMSAYVDRTCDLSQPTIVKSTNRAVDGKPQITWNKVPGAAKYEIYRATSAKGTYTKMYTTVYTTYTNTSATAGNTYYYKVIAVSDRTSYANSAMSAYVDRTCDVAAPVLSVSSTAKKGALTLTWKAVSGAGKYEIYRATSKNGTYYKYGSATGTKYINTSVSKGKTYYYKVKAISSRTSYADSALSNIGYATVK